jgi:uncharacterized protein (DUF2384 family)
MNRTNEQGGRKIGPDGHSFGRVKESAEEKASMKPHIALEPLRVRLQSLADSSSSVLPSYSLDILREAGLTSDEVNGLVFASNKTNSYSETGGSLAGDDTSRLKVVAGLLAHCIQVYGSDNAAGWLHQPMRHFNRKSPLEFVMATGDFDEVNGCLIEASEGYFF